MKDILNEYPQYSLTNLLDVVGRHRDEERVSRSLSKTDNYYPITEKAYKRFMDKWEGEPLDIVKTHDYFSWMGMSNYYVYTIESRRVLAKIRNTVNGQEYYLALNA
jgi:hypothetical protein